MNAAALEAKSALNLVRKDIVAMVHGMFSDEFLALDPIREQAFLHEMQALLVADGKAYKAWADALNE